MIIKVYKTKKIKTYPKLQVELLDENHTFVLDYIPIGKVTFYVLGSQNTIGDTSIIFNSVNGRTTFNLLKEWSGRKVIASYETKYKETNYNK